MSCAIFYANLVIFVALCIMAALGHVERFSPQNDSPKIVYLYMSGCPHCVRFMPEWENFARVSKISTLKLENADAKSAQYKKIAQSAGIFRGFPCVFYYNPADNKIVEYSGNRSMMDLLQWSAKLIN
jgi:thiol-disulfide isomerase/thioredoxin